MSTAGMQIFNSDGVKILMPSNNVIKPIGTFIAQYGKEQSITDDSIVGKRITIFPQKIELVHDGNTKADTYPCEFTIDGNTIKWRYLGQANWNPAAGVDESYLVYKITYMYGWY